MRRKVVPVRERRGRSKWAGKAARLAATLPTDRPGRAAPDRSVATVSGYGGMIPADPGTRTLSNPQGRSNQPWVWDCSSS
ncbi:hypothetical protein GCM10019017_07440 [Streptomyces showdoensis]